MYISRFVIGIQYHVGPGRYLALERGGKWQGHPGIRMYPGISEEQVVGL